MKKFYKSTREKQLAGVLGGLSEIYNLEVSILRIITVILAFLTSGFFILIYIIAAIVLPTDNDLYQ
ncbi:PspC domain-containing protein [Virgibacillus siamensis]|uniref:PspC domain-containing protein n=1 Tax=Virgibacillus siamensis TaxID=480071 RepID=UPI000984EDA8|nr:PspC domain-containing protein [Virgibacillus siamensis]